MLTAGRPVFVSSLLILRAVSLEAISLAEDRSFALTLISTRVLSDKRRRVEMISILTIVTSSFGTPATIATDVLKAACLSSVKSSFDMGMDTTMTTTNMFVGIKDCGGGVTHVVFEFAPISVEKVPESHVIQSDSWRPPEVGRYFPAPQFWQAVMSFAPVMVEYLPGIQAIHASTVFAPD